MRTIKKVTITEDRKTPIDILLIKHKSEYKVLDGIMIVGVYKGLFAKLRANLAFRTTIKEY